MGTEQGSEVGFWVRLIQHDKPLDFTGLCSVFTYCLSSDPYNNPIRQTCSSAMHVAKGCLPALPSCVAAELGLESRSPALFCNPAIMTVPTPRAGIMEQLQHKSILRLALKFQVEPCETDYF